jgi:LuxR family maltose regulon positive regulatory protein
VGLNGFMQARLEPESDPLPYRPTGAADRLGLRSGIIQRDRLVEEICVAGDVPLVLVVGGAGYGKTTLLSQWVGQDVRPCVWMTLGKQHDDPAVLVEDLVRALGDVEPFDAATRRGLQATTADFTSVLLPRVGRAIASRARPFVLVLDDVQVLTRRATWAMVQTIADCIPAGSQLALASRTDPQLSLARMRADRRVVTVTTTSLATTAREAAELLRAGGLTISDEEVNRLVERTEGWPAGLYLATLALREQPDASDAGALFAGDDRLVAAYLRDELLRKLPRRTRDLFVHTSVLESLSGPLCDAVLERSDSTQVLDVAANANLLLFPLDRRGEWYRYHHLLREMLRFELQRREPELEPELHRRASRWYEEHGEVDAAISHAIAAGDSARVDALTWQAVPLFVSIGRTATVERWLEPFSPAEIAARPALTVSAAWAALTAGDMGLLNHWAAVASEHDPDELLPDGTPVGAAAALLRATLAEHGIVRMGDDAASAFALDRAGSPYQSVACYLEGAALRLQGQPAAARRRLEQGAAIGKLLTPAAHAHCLGQLALLAIADDDWPEADRFVQQVLDIVDRFELTERPAMAGPLAVTALVRARLGDSAGARTCSKQALFLLSMLTNVGPWIGIEARLLLARTALLLGDVPQARVLVREIDSLVALTPDAQYFEAPLVELRQATDADLIPLGVAAAPMTPAELRVLRYLPTHLTFAAIADELFVSRNTVKTHAISIYRKLGVSSRDPAVAAARRLGLLEH